MKAKAILKSLSNFYPEYRQYHWDNSGVQILLDEEVDTIALALDPTIEAVREADELGAQVLLTHHPLFFKPPKSLSADKLGGALAIECIKRGISLYTMHTSYDNHPQGMGYHFLKGMAFELKGPLREVGATELSKIVVFCPEGSTEDVATALAEAGAGTIGNYSECSFRTKGEGVFRGNEGAQPTIGTVGVLERVDEDRLEMIFPTNRKGALVQALLKAHPYEAPAYDLYPLHNKVDTYGCGVIGISNGMSGEEFLQRVEQFFGSTPEKVYGSLKKTIKRIGYVGGAGSEFVRDAARSKCDVYVTGEVRYHDLEYTRGTSTAVIQMGHGVSERPAFYACARDVEIATGCRVVVCSDCFEMY